AAWAQVYRSLEHGFAKNACMAVRSLRFPRGLAECADAFVDLQQERHKADYDPVYRIRRRDALARIKQAEQAINDLIACDLKDRKAFAIQLLFKKRV
ncbi:hypothetical protein JZU48_01650, partial [bacterium]|nr:hypothetical protein [bacterium]